MRVCYNRKYSTVPLYNEWGDHEGDLYPGEVFFVAQQGDGPMGIWFRYVDGKMRGVTLGTDDAYKANNEFIRDIFLSPYSTQYINGREAYTFLFRQRMPIYDINGNLWGHVEAGQRVACLKGMYDGNSQTGSNKKPYCLLCNYVLRGNKWVKIGGDHGFVDVGVETVGSEASRVPLIGDWNR